MEEGRLNVLLSIVNLGVCVCEREIWWIALILICQMHAICSQCFLRPCTWLHACTAENSVRSPHLPSFSLSSERCLLLSLYSHQHRTKSSTADFEWWLSIRIFPLPHLPQNEGLFIFSMPSVSLLPFLFFWPQQARTRSQAQHAQWAWKEKRGNHITWSGSTSEAGLDALKTEEKTEWWTKTVSIFRSLVLRLVKWSSFRAVFSTVDLQSFR